MPLKIFVDLPGTIHFTRVIFIGTHLSRWMSPKPFGNRAELHLPSTGAGKCVGGNWGTGGIQGICDPGFGLSRQTGLCGLLGFPMDLFTQQNCVCLCRDGIKTCCLGERNSSKATTPVSKFRFDSKLQIGNAGESHVWQSDPVQSETEERSNT